MAAAVCAMSVNMSISAERDTNRYTASCANADHFLSEGETGRLALAKGPYGQTEVH